MNELIPRERIEEHAKAAAKAWMKTGAATVNPYSPMTDAGHVWQECFTEEVEGVEMAAA
jgi:hypothetical protein